jgi:hypothetical protein
MPATPISDQAFFSAYENCAERMFPGVTVLTPEQDEAAIYEASQGA